MTPSEIEQFVSTGGRTSFVVAHPSSGIQSRPKPALRVFATENKIAVYTGDDGDPVVSVYSSVKRVGDTLVLQAVRPFPAPRIYIAKVKPESSRDKEYDDAFEGLDDSVGGNWEVLRERATEAMESTRVWEEPPHTVTVHYMNWFEYSGDENFSGPKGIVAIAPGGVGVVGVPFPGHEAAAAEFVHWKGIQGNPERALRGLALEAGSRNLFFSEPREMTGHSWSDATQRALFDYGVEIYAKTNRSPF